MPDTNLLPEVTSGDLVRDYHQNGFGIVRGLFSPQKLPHSTTNLVGY